MDFFKSLYKISEYDYWFDLDSKTAVIKFMIPYGYLSDGENKGYAHLMEHMIIQENKEYFKELEQQGIQFNALTSEYMTEFVFLDAEGHQLTQQLKSGSLKLAFLKFFRKESLELEQKTILEEHALLSNRTGRVEADTMIGTTEEIKNFNLAVLNRLKREIYQNYHTILFGPAVFFNPEKTHYERYKENRKLKRWSERIDIIEAVKKPDGSGINLLLQADLYGELFAYCMHILFSDLIGGYTLEIKKKPKLIVLEIRGAMDELGEVLKYKVNSFYRYDILFSSFQFLCKEITYLLYCMSERVDLEKAYLEENWEDKLYEICSP
ncbi:insulinase family protein [Anaerocolumna sp. AGMB13025]|uniref:insulinase family protein n=1 Tax=Anaerocolumna sp. AGMB13025 TaxID=3039116 RepID=UPI00241FD472|nr:insulinase family protein [Anaerocolumna sp. AGMB13025]WFR56985.1 insulinase family protein [Anaerocolumna sp. AGMB13025]